MRKLSEPNAVQLAAPLLRSPMIIHPQFLKLISPQIECRSLDCGSNVRLFSDALYTAIVVGFRSFAERKTTIKNLTTLIASAMIMLLPLMANAQNPGAASAEQNAAVPGEISLTLRDNLSAAEQRAAIIQILGSLEEERFMRRSIVSPFVFDLRSVSKLEQGGHRQQLDVWFVAHGQLKDIEEKKMIDDLTGPEAKQTPGLPEVARALTEAEMQSRNLPFGEQPDGTSHSYGIMGANVLDKVFVTGITKSEYKRTDDSITLLLSLAPTLMNDSQFPARWHSITKTDAGDFQLGDARDYSDLSAVIKVTPLVGVEDALFVEVHVIYAEPFDWFEGRNLLRSKLPPVIQDSVRKFRRKLAQ